LTREFGFWKSLMMARPLRIEGEGCVYHLTARGDRRGLIFWDDEDRGRFRERLVESLSRFNVELHAWVLMPNHFHLLARTREANLSRWLQWLLGTFTMDFNRRHRQCGHLFQGRFKSLLVEERGYFAELSRYIHLNPVRGARLGEGELTERRARLRAFPWSSYRAYAGLAAVPGWLRTTEAYAELGLERAKDGKVKYRRFVERGLLDEVRDRRGEAEGQVLLGGESFVQRMKDRLLAAKEGGKAMEGTTKGGLLRARERGEKLLEEIARSEGVTEETLCLRRLHGDPARMKAMARLHLEAGWTLNEIGKKMGGMTANAVAQTIHRWRRRSET
jgi:putative transposase